ncbi:MAG: hypothetical protein WBP93_09475 [Pyrinomonadaceae bacterium]
MSDRYAVNVSIAGISLVSADAIPYRVELVDADEFLSAYGGSSIEAADGGVYTQLINVDQRAVHFGLRVPYHEAWKLAAVKAAINTALAAGESFRVTAQDDVVAVDVQCVPDFTAKWITHESQSGGILKGVTYRFISVE